MKNEIRLVKIETDYCNYLREFDDKVPYNYNEKELRPFVGILFEVNNFKYFAPLSSPKPKHLKMHSKIDFLKLDDGKLGAVNFNNMLPVDEKNIIYLDLDKKNILSHEKKYQKLLKEQLYWLNRNDEKLYSRSYNLYNKYINKQIDKRVYERCCNFQLLEEKCAEYNKTITVNS